MLECSIKEFIRIIYQRFQINCGVALSMNVYVVHFSGEWKKAIILVINGSRRHYDSEVTFCWSEKNLLAMLLSHVVMIMDE